MKKKKCPFCKDGLLERQTIKETYTYKGHALEVNQPGEFCNSCASRFEDLTTFQKLSNLGQILIRCVKI